MDISLVLRREFSAEQNLGVFFGKKTVWGSGRDSILDTECGGVAVTLCWGKRRVATASEL